LSGPILYDFGGLQTAAGLLARNPASCVIAENWRFPQPGVMRKRTGFKLGTQTAGVNEVFASLMSSPEMADKFIAQGGGAGVPALYYGAPNSAWATLTNTASLTNFFSRHARIAVCGGSTYVSGGATRRIEGSFGSYRAAGMPRGLSPFTYSMNAAVYSVLVAGTAPFLPDGANVAYRVTYHVKNGDTELSGPPTSRLVIRNIAGTSGYAAATTRAVTLRIPLPYELDSATVQVPATFYWRLWRSRTATGADSADDELYEVGEAFFTATDIANGYAVFTDNTPDTFLTTGPRLNTNSSNFPPLEAGVLNGQTHADEAPPALCQDIAEFAGCVFYAQPGARASALVVLLSPSFAAGNTVVINGTTLTAVAGVPVNPGDFTIVTTLSTLGLNIEATARNICDALNRTTGRASITASYVSQGTQLPGQIFLEANAGVASWTIQSAAAGSLFRPNITTAQTNATPSSTNTVSFSKLGRGDAVPVFNSLTIGPSSATVFRIVPFRERLLCFTSAGVYQIDGTYYGNFTVSLVDATARLFQQEAVVVQDDKCFAWCFNGILQIDDGGTSYVSTPIEPTLQTIVNQTASLGSFTIYQDAFAVAGKADHLVYFFYTLSGIGTPNCTKWLEYDARAQKWSTGATTDGSGRSAGAIQASTGLLVLGNGTANNFSPSGVAKAFTARALYDGTTDYSDDNTSGTPSAIVATATFQFQVPDTDARQHWQQLLLEFEKGEQSYFTGPSQVRLSWETDAAGATSLATYGSLTSALLRVETPTNQRRATRQRVTVVHQLTEHIGLVALNQSVAGVVARWPK
jgi:hypothetical protein